MSWPPIICVNAECVYILYNHCCYIPSAFDRSARAYIISCAFVYIPVRSICMREYVHKVQCVTIFPVRPVRSSAVLSLTQLTRVYNICILLYVRMQRRHLGGLGAVAPKEKEKRKKKEKREKREKREKEKRKL